LPSEGREPELLIGRDEPELLARANNPWSSRLRGGWQKQEI
jgi:hypothetical protein